MNGETMNGEMNGITAYTLHEQVEAAVQVAWPAFAAEHPALARVIDAQTLHDYVVDSLADDEAFRQAYRQAVEANVAARAVAELVSTFVGPVLRRLL